ncbi:Uma2 family endonuclease [Altericista sp. CCNU0014]|uniref:Uma2 family endonuclease n=1 Tax=Altericista sp. CCNU0014 TaxID=3082949 RepID=UPI00384C6E57
MKTLAKWSVEDYHSMIGAGVLRDRKVELLEGEIVEMSPETPIHYSTASQSSNYLREILRDKAAVRFNGPITLDTSEPEPDIAIVRLPESAYSNRHPGPEDIYWLIEVARTSLSKDLDLKAAIYAAANVQEYWVLDLADPRIIVLREPQGRQYLSEQIFRTGMLSPLTFPDLQVAVERLI